MNNVDSGLPASADVHTKEWRTLLAEHGQDFGSRFDVLLDGVKMPKVYAFDAEAGWVSHMLVDEDGKVRLNDARDDAERVTKHGRVEVRWRKELAA